MSNQYSGRQSDNRQRSGDQNYGGQPPKKGSGGETRSQIAEGMQSTTNTAKRAASEAAFHDRQPVHTYGSKAAIPTTSGHVSFGRTSGTFGGSFPRRWPS